MNQLRMKIAVVMEKLFPSCSPKIITPELVRNVALGNFYPTGATIFPFHSDREEIGNSIPLASLSLGAERDFIFLNLVPPSMLLLILSRKVNASRS